MHMGLPPVCLRLPFVSHSFDDVLRRDNDMPMVAELAGGMCVMRHP